MTTCLNLNFFGTKPKKLKVPSNCLYLDAAVNLDAVDYTVDNQGLLILCASNDYNTDHLITLLQSKTLDHCDNIKLLSKSVALKRLTNNCKPDLTKVVKANKHCIRRVASVNLESFNHENIKLYKTELVMCIVDMTVDSITKHLNSDGTLRHAINALRVSQRYPEFFYLDAITDICTDICTPHITMQETTDLFNLDAVKNSTRIRYNLLNALLLSKTHCHLVLNNSELLSKMSDHITRFKPLYRVVFGHSWKTLVDEEEQKMEDCDLTVDDRTMFTLDTASKLPVFPYFSKDIYLNPYVTTPVSTDCVTKSCTGVPMMFRDEDELLNYQDLYGINNQATFDKYFNLATTGSDRFNIFDGYPRNEDGTWQDLSVYGDFVSVCAKKRLDRALQPLFNSATMTNKEYLLALSSYQNTLCVTINSTDRFKFIDQADKLIKHIKQNSLRISESAYKQTAKKLMKVMVQLQTAVRIEVTSKYVSDVLLKKYTQEEIDEYMLNHDSLPELHETMYGLYVTCKLKQNSESPTKRRRYADCFKLASINGLTVRVNDCCNILSSHTMTVTMDHFLNNQDNTTAVRISHNCSYHIIGGLVRTFIKMGPQFTDVSRYNGKTTFLPSSNITMLMNNLHISNKSTSGIKVLTPALAMFVNQSVRNGIGTVLNNKDRQRLTNSDNDTPSGDLDIIKHSTKLGVKNLVSVVKLTGVTEGDRSLGAFYKVGVEDKNKRAFIDTLLTHSAVGPDGVNVLPGWLLNAAYDNLS